MTARIATMIYNILASRLPESQYAIHCVVYGIVR